MEFKFQPGDRVILVDVEDCKFGCNNHMRILEGSEATVVTAEEDLLRKFPCYRVEGNFWSWSENNFVPAVPLFEESDFESILL